MSVGVFFNRILNDSCIHRESNAAERIKFFFQVLHVF